MSPDPMTTSRQLNDALAGKRRRFLTGPFYAALSVGVEAGLVVAVAEVGAPGG